MQAPQLKHWILLVLLSLAWGFAFYLIAVALESFPPLTIVNIRLAVGALTLFLVMHWQGHRLPRETAWWWRFALLTIMGNLIPFSLITWAETEISSSQAGLLMALMPISTMVLSHFFVHEDSLTPRRLCGVLLGFGGVLVLVGGEALKGIGGGALLAQLAVLGATLAYASNAVYTKRLPPINTIVVATGSLGVGTVLLLPFSLYLEQAHWVAPSFNALAATPDPGRRLNGARHLDLFPRGIRLRPLVFVDHQLHYPCHRLRGRGHVPGRERATQPVRGTAVNPGRHRTHPEPRPRVENNSQ